jgi:hypothetical protein
MATVMDWADPEVAWFFAGMAMGLMVRLWLHCLSSAHRTRED